MLSLIVALMVGQTSPGKSPDKEFLLPCPQGHNFRVVGHQEGGYFLLKLKAPANPGHELTLLDTTGVNRDRLPATKTGHAWYGGNVTYQTATGAAGDKPNRVHLTFIGSQVEREAVRKNLEADPGFRTLAADMGDYLAVQDYGPENPLVRDVGLAAGGKPDIVIQTTKGGKVTYRARSYPGPDVIVQEIRRADPKYDAAKDPSGGGNGFPDILKSLNLTEDTANEIGIGVIAGLIACFLIRKANP